MSNTVTQHPTAKLVLPSELHEPLEILKRYGIPLAAGVGLALVVVLGFTFYKNRAESSRRDALLLMASAKSFDELERVVSDYQGTPAAPLALLKIAHAYYSAGNYTLARDKYDTFTTQYATHEMAPVAELGSLHCAEAQGKIDETMRGFENFASRHPGNFLTPQAIIGQARCLEQAGRLTQARILYEQFLAANPNSAWTRRVEDLLAMVNKDIAAGRDGVARLQAPVAAPKSADAFAPLNLPMTPAP